MPARSTYMSEPIAPPANEINSFCGRISASELWLAGPRQDARDSSQMPHISRFALTDAPEPELDPSEPARVESNTLDGFPPQVLR